jgi:hypothetical protein
MACINCDFIRYSSATSPFRNIVVPFVYVLFSECVAGKVFEKDPRLYTFKLGFSHGGQDRFMSIVEGWKYRDGRTRPLGDCKNWTEVGVWRMKRAEVFERKFVREAKTLMRIVPRDVYMSEPLEGEGERTNGESEIYWLAPEDFVRLKSWQEAVCLEERGSFEALADIFAKIKIRGEEYREKVMRERTSQVSSNA